MNRCQKPRGMQCRMPQNVRRQPLVMSDCNQGVIENMPLAIAYVQWQKWGQLYDPETSLMRGTIFPELDLPFCGSGVRMRG